MKKVLLISLLCLAISHSYAQVSSYALEFDGIDDYVSFDGVILPETFTVEMWVNAYSTHTNQTFVGKNGPEAQNIFLVGYYGDDLMVYLPNDKKFGIDQKKAGYQHLAVVVKKNSSTFSNVKVFQNGILVGENNLESVMNDGPANLALQIGMEYDPDASDPDDELDKSDFFHGQMDELRIWNEVRTQQEIRDNMHVRLNGDEENLLGYWKMNEGSGQQIEDIAGVNDGYRGSIGSGNDDNDPAWSLALFPHSLNPGIRASSNFSTNDEGWTFVDGGNGPFYKASEGNPDGCIRGIDDGTNWWKYSAPSKFLGNVSNSYGYSICFDMYQLYTDAPLTDSANVVLVNDTLSLSFNIHRDPKIMWLKYSAPLMEGIEEGHGWINDSTGKTATKEEFQKVLSNLTQLKIFGEFRSGDDESWLDNVILYRKPSVNSLENTLNDNGVNSNMELRVVPNPLADQCSISFNLSETSPVHIALYDLNGKLFEMIYSGKMFPGYHNIEWNSQRYSSGIYFIKIQSNNAMGIQKCIKF